MKKGSLVSKLFNRYFIVALNGMALGLFCTLIIGLIIWLVIPILANDAL